MNERRRIGEIFKNRAGGFFIRTKKSVILKHAHPPVKSFKSPGEAVRCARRMGLSILDPSAKFFWVEDNWNSDNPPAYVARSSRQALRAYIKDHEQLIRKKSVNREIKTTELTLGQRITFHDSDAGDEITVTVKRFLRTVTAPLPVMALCDGAYC